MFYAVSLNSCLDKSAALPFFTPDAPNRIQIQRTDVGGKGVNVARALHGLGEKAMLIGFDYAGAPVAAAMAKEGIGCTLLPIEGDMRVNLKIRETDTGRTLEISESGPPVSPERLSEIEDTLLRLVKPGDWVSLSGRLPPGAPDSAYARLCEKLNERGCLTAADCDGAALHACLDARPALIKPNAQEFAALTGVDPRDTRKTAARCRALLQRGIRWVCVSCGAEGAILCGPGGCWRCKAASVQALGTQGAGDSMLAALMAALSRGWPEEKALPYACAAAGASVMRPGTLLCRKEDAERLFALQSGAEAIE